MRRGFTMIELIFVIVIIGILAAVAIPKLAATRDDAKAAKAVANLKTCINDIGSYYTSTTQEAPTGSSASGDAFASCKAVADDAAFTVAGVADNPTASDGNITVINAGLGKTWSDMAEASATKKGLSGATAVTHSFGGAKVVE